jgi:hypothetical protein
LRIDRGRWGLTAGNLFIYGYQMRTGPAFETCFITFNLLRINSVLLSAFFTDYNHHFTPWIGIASGRD